jgi:hypothetical protein
MVSRPCRKGTKGLLLVANHGDRRSRLDINVKYVKKQVMLICLCLGVIFATLGYTILNRTGGSGSLPPMRSLTLTIDISHRQDFFDQLQKFADKHDFRLVLKEYEKIEHFRVEIWGDDILITTNDVPPDPTLVYISFYGNFPGASGPVNEEVVDNLVGELKDLIYEIPNVTISEQN